MKNRFSLLLTFALAAALPVFSQSGSNSSSQTPPSSNSTPSTSDAQPQNGASSSQNSTGTTTPGANSTTGANDAAPAQSQGTDPAAASQNSNQNNAPADQQPQFTFRSKVTQRSTEAVDYRDRGGATQIDFKGSSLMPRADGRAKVTGHTGRLAIDAAFHHLEPPRSLGAEFLTYVLWAIDPEGRAANLGEVVPNDNGDASVQVTSGFQEFGMILTAEPYFAVSRPGDVLVAENIVRQDTEGGIHPITARYELLQKGQYTVNVSGSQLPAANDKNSPLQVQEAENAIAIAQAAGAEDYAGDTLHKAKDYLHQAQEYIRQKQNRVPIGTVSRAATQAAEDARLITLEKKQQEQVAAERQAAQDKIQQAQTQADQESARAEAARLDAQHQSEQRALAEQERLAADQARQQAEQARLEAQASRDQAQQQLQQAQIAQQQAQAAQQASLQQQQLLSQQAEQARQQAQQAEQQRQKLLQQLNQVLQTKDTAKGLIVNVSDVLFDTGKATLKQGAQLRLARVAGIILAYPDLKLEIDGYTDSTGTPALNQKLSDKRASTVRDFLVGQGLSSDNVTSRGFGESDPVASNKTAAGRQQNRRVELVVSGTAIGQNIAPGSGTGTTPAPGTTTLPATAAPNPTPPPSGNPPRE
jgi:outer membrane protein OmpA-like peptidoglycan-associated protein